MDYIKSETDAQIVVPDSQLIQYKEAMIFALLGAMRVKNVINISGSTTGASRSVIGGSLEGDFSKIL